MTRPVGRRRTEPEHALSACSRPSHRARFGRHRRRRGCRRLRRRRRRHASATSRRPARPATATGRGCGPGRCVCRILPASASGLPAKPRPDGFRRISRRAGEPLGAYGYGVETSRGKDTPSGHWEIAGVPVDFDWGYFPAVEPCFPSALTEALDPRERICPAFSATGTPRGSRSSRSSARNSVADRQADLLHLRRQRSSRSRRTRAPSASSGSTGCAGSRGGSAIRYRSAASSRGRSSATRIAAFTRTANRSDYATPAAASRPCSTGWHDAGRARRQRRQDRRHLRAPRHGDRGQGAGQHGDVERGRSTPSTAWPTASSSS